jgi:hypothetical protein
MGINQSDIIDKTAIKARFLGVKVMASAIWKYSNSKNSVSTKTASTHCVTSCAFENLNFYFSLSKVWYTMEACSLSRTFRRSFLELIASPLLSYEWGNLLL